MSRRIKFLSLILVLCVCLSTTVTATSAEQYHAMIAQGNTTDWRDCKVFFEKLKEVPDGNNYLIYNRGWQYNDGDCEMMEYRASEDHLEEAKDMDLLYWSGHGASNPLRLNVNATVQSGKFETIDLVDALGVGTSNWRNTALWDKDSRLSVVIFGACNILDNTYDEAKYLVRAMKASNIRVIAGYHETSPTHPRDAKIAEYFFDNPENGGVQGGESIRSSWQTANEEYDPNNNWAVLCYKSNSNQYYRIPGFPGKTYSAPDDDASVYRFWNQYTSPTGGQVIPTNASIEPLPLELTRVSSDNTIQASAFSSDQPLLREEATVSVARELNDTGAVELQDEVQRALADDFALKAFSIADMTDRAIISTSDVMCEEIDEETGTVPGSETLLGKTYCYSNQYNGVRIVDNFAKVGTDADGVYFAINKWCEVTPVEANSVSEVQTSSIDLNTALQQNNFSTSEVERAELVYIPITDSTFRLAYEVELYEGVYYLDYQTGELVFPC